MPQPLPPEVLEQIAERFRVLAEPNRLRILNLLLTGERTVSDLVEETGLTQANVSKHLGLLRSSQFVERRCPCSPACGVLSLDPCVPTSRLSWCGLRKRRTMEWWR